MRLTVLVVGRKFFIHFRDFIVEKIDHPWHPMDQIRKSERLLWARPGKLLNDMLIVFIWREGLRLA